MIYVANLRFQGAFAKPPEILMEGGTGWLGRTRL